MLKSPLISVIIPSYNQGDYLEDTITSILSQGIDNVELIIIDGGSTDNSIEIIKKYERLLAYWHSKEDRGQADAINQGFRIATGDVLCWINSDDMYIPGTLRDIAARFSGKQQAEHLVYGGAIILNQSAPHFYSYGSPSRQFNAEMLTYTDYIIQPSAFWTRSLWERTGELCERYNYIMDWDWFIRGAKFCNYEYVQKYYSLYRYHPLHKSGTSSQQRQAEILEVVNNHADDYWKWLYDQVYKHYHKLKPMAIKLRKSRSPKRNLLLYSFFFSIMSRLRSWHDLYYVLGMLE